MAAFTATLSTFTMGSPARTVSPFSAYRASSSRAWGISRSSPSGGVSVPAPRRAVEMALFSGWAVRTRLCTLVPDTTPEGRLEISSAAAATRHSAVTQRAPWPPRSGMLSSVSRGGIELSAGSCLRPKRRFFCFWSFIWVPSLAAIVQGLDGRQLCGLVGGIQAEDHADGEAEGHGNDHHVPLQAEGQAHAGHHHRDDPQHRPA